jgi:hypothetical protein
MYNAESHNFYSSPDRLIVKECKKDGYDIYCEKLNGQIY